MNLLADAFGDDEHTATTDAYTRAMKCRKWVVLSAVAYWVAHSEAFTPVKFGLGVANMRVDEATWAGATAIGLIYISWQYCLLLGQLAFRYRPLLRERLGLREIERLQQTRRRLESLQFEIDANINGRPNQLTAHTQRMDERLGELEHEREQLQKLLEAATINEYQPLYVVIEVTIDVARLTVPFLAVAAGLRIIPLP